LTITGTGYLRRKRVTPRYHGTTAKLNVALEMAKKVMRLKKNLKDADTECRYEIDDLASMAQMILLEVEEREKE